MKGLSTLDHFKDFFVLVALNDIVPAILVVILDGVSLDHLDEFGGGDGGLEVPAGVLSHFGSPFGV